MNWLIAYWFIAVALDWSSTIVQHDWRVEENPVMQYYWRQYGDLGFTLVTIYFALIIWAIIWLAHKERLYFWVCVGMFPIITFKILIALTNLAVIPYSVTSWFQMSGIYNF